MSRDDFKRSFQVSPIILVDGVAASAPGGMLPIISITQAGQFTTGLLSSGGDLPLDDYLAAFEPIPGGTLIDQDIGKYTFANQFTAANAIIVKPLHISMRMVAPARQPGDYTSKLATFSNVQATLYKHNILGGLYTIATPAFLYTNCVMLTLTDVTGGESNQVQAAWRWDFELPLVTQQQAQQAQNTLLSKITAGVPTDGSQSGPGQAVGSPVTGAAPSSVPAAQSLTGTSVPASTSQPGSTSPFFQSTQTNLTGTFQTSTNNLGP